MHKMLFTFFEELKNIENRVAWFLAELCKAEKGAKRQGKPAMDRAYYWVFSIWRPRFPCHNNELVDAHVQLNPNIQIAMTDDHVLFLMPPVASGPKHLTELT
jgi:hypothetical protein